MIACPDVPDDQGEQNPATLDTMCPSMTVSLCHPARVPMHRKAEGRRDECRGRRQDPHGEDALNRKKQADTPVPPEAEDLCAGMDRRFPSRGTTRPHATQERFPARYKRCIGQLPAPGRSMDRNLYGPATGSGTESPALARSPLTVSGIFRDLGSPDIAIVPSPSITYTAGILCTL